MIGRGEAEPETCTEIAAVATPGKLAGPGDWSRESEWEQQSRKVSGQTSKQPDGFRGEDVNSRVGTQEGTRSIRQWSAPGSRMDWAACTISRTDIVGGTGSGTDEVAGSGSNLGVGSCS